MGPDVVKVVRDGSKETIEQTMPPMPGRDKEYHSVRLYDFQAHKIYLKILSEPTMACGVQDFNDAAAPPELDPISGSAALLKELMGDGQMKMTGTATINGISAKVMEMTSPTGNGTVWLAQNGGFVVKLAGVGPDGKPQTIIEIKQLSFAKPPASAFAIPAGCESVETPVKPSTNVSALTLEPIGNYTGACPAHIKMVGTIKVDGPGTVFYQFGAGSMEPGETIVFAAAGTKTVTHTMTLQPKYGNDMGAGAILEAIGADASGKHGIPTQGSNNSSFNITCTSGGGK
jgi:plastocyanin